ncbi:MAG: glycoside-pentoside-hexuronide (GPH):cation symporter [Eubacteriales bacterium]|jgi:melibiose permease
MKLTARNKIAFCLGAFGKDIVYMLVNSYVLYYYNTVLGMSATFIGIVLMAARIFDALNDPFMGIVVAKTKTRHGRYRPWILTGTILNAVVIYALFAVPDNMADSSMRVWLAVFYIAWGVTYTLMDIPFWSMIPAITEPGAEREQLSSLARSASGIGDALPTVLTMIVVPVLAGTGSLTTHFELYKPGFRSWALIIAVVFVVTEVIFYFNVPEKKPEDMTSVGIGQMFKSLFRNDQAMVIVLSVILVYMALDITGNLILYFFQFDMGNTDLYSVFAAVCFLAQVIFMLLVPALRKKIEKLKLFAAGIFVQIIGYVILLILSNTSLYKNFWEILLVPGILIYAGFGILNVMLTVFLSDTVDYGQAKYGTREESVIFSMQTFTVKLASGVAAFLCGCAIDWIGLDVESEVVQSSSTLFGLHLWITVPPVILLIIALLVFRKKYMLNDGQMERIQNKISEHKL